MQSQRGTQSRDLVNNCPRVQLTREEAIAAALVGAQRRMISHYAGQRDTHGMPADMVWMFEMEGALAECAFAKLVGLYWSATVNTFKGADVGRKIQVRQTIHEFGTLRITKEDPDEDLFVLMTGKLGSYTFRGAVRGWKGKQEQWWGKLRADREYYSFNIPQRFLESPWQYINQEREG